MPFSMVSPTRRGCPRCGAPLNIGSDTGADTALCGSCLLLAGLEEPPSYLTDEITVASADPPEPDGLGLQLGDHVLVRELGRGSMGIIYEARQPGTGRPVALKTISRSLAEEPDVRLRFAREAEAAASLDHAFVLPVYEVGEDGGRPYFTMKLAEGGSLLKALPRYSGRPREAVALMAKVARGVAHAHSRGVLHRDLKPGNVLLDADGETPLVSDFGLARWLDRDSDLTQSLIIFGTPGYMAPEQARHAGKAGPAADVYSLGAMLFQLLCGRTPFRGANAMDVIEQAAAGPAPRLRTFNPRAARDLETICARCLEIEPVSRPKCAADLAEDLERWLAGHPIRMHPVRLPERVWRWSVRNPWLAGAAAGCLVLGVVAGVRHRESRRLEGVLQEEALAKATVAVLPLEDLGASAGEPPYLTAPSLNASFRQQLAATSGLRVVDATVPASSDAGRVADLQLIGHQARAPAILGATVLQRSDGADLALRLVDTATGATLARTLVRLPSANVAPALAAAISTILAQLPRAGSSVAESDGTLLATADSTAREYLRLAADAMTRGSAEGMQRANECFRQAIRADGKCAFAHAGLAYNLATLSAFDDPGGRLREATQEATLAMSLAPELAASLEAQGSCRWQANDAHGALDSLLHAYQLSPDGYRAPALIGYVCGQLGRPAHGLTWLERADRRRARAGAYAKAIGDLWADLEEDGRAEQAYTLAVNFRPEMPDGELGRCWLHLRREQFDAAREICARLTARHPHMTQVNILAATTEFYARRPAAAEPLFRGLLQGDPTGGLNSPGALVYASVLGYLRGRDGAEAEGRALLEQARAQALENLRATPDHPRWRYALAATCAALGEREPALDALERAVAAGWTDRRAATLDPRFDLLVGDPRFDHILSQLAARLAASRR